MKKFILYVLPILNIYSIFGDINITVNENKTINNKNLPNDIAFNNETGELTIENFKNSNETVSIKTPHKVHLKGENSFNKLKIDGRFSNNGVTQANNVEFKGKGGVNYGAILAGKELSEKEKRNLRTNTEQNDEETPNNHDFTITNYGIIKSRTMDLKNNANVTNEPHQYQNLPIGAYISKSTIDTDKANLSNGSKVNIWGGNFKTKDLLLDNSSKIEGEQRNKDGIVTYHNQQDEDTRTKLEKLSNKWNNLTERESNLKTDKEKVNFYFQRYDLDKQYKNILNNPTIRITETPDLFELLTRLNNSNTSISTSQPGAVTPPPPPPPAPVPPPPPPPPGALQSVKLKKVDKENKPLSHIDLIKQGAFKLKKVNKEEKTQAQGTQQNIQQNVADLIKAGNFKLRPVTKGNAQAQGTQQNIQQNVADLIKAGNFKLRPVTKENAQTQGTQQNQQLSHLDLIKAGKFKLKPVTKETEEQKKEREEKELEEKAEQNPNSLTIQELLELEMLKRRKDIENNSDDEENSDNYAW